MSALGHLKTELDTPALVVDLPTLDRNLERMAKTIIGHGVRWRPHTKGQKVPQLAARALAAGAIGVTCAKLGEAEVMAAAGVRDILIANQIVGAEKMRRLVALRRVADVMVLVDGPEQVAELSAAAQAGGVELRVLVEVDVGMNRCGVAPGEPVVALARRVTQAPGLRFAGLEAWEGHCTRAAEPAAKRACVEQALALLIDSAARCRAAGLPVEIVNCGGTATYWIAATVPGVTEIQAGGGVFHDRLYADHFGVEGEFALTVMTTVISRPTPTRLVVDAGKKTMSSDAAVPRPIGLPGVQSVALSAEHGTVVLDAPSATPRVGDRLEFIVGYSDTTVFLHDELYAVRDGRVEAVWPILGRGKLR
jgi:D-serine deaminase-like pyridoxal phosphate-dependent protein